MSKEKKRHGLLIDYEYCTGCYACQVACCQEYGHEAGSSGMSVIEQVHKRRNGQPYLAFIPFPTELCILCNPRTKKGLEPACAQHCMASVIKWGEVEELAKEMRQKPRQVLWAPK